jgi:hypothetical protein
MDLLAAIVSRRIERDSSREKDGHPDADGAQTIAEAVRRLRRYPQMKAI